ncbi:hypothetical protein Xen7305DRAFT_00052780 [Xenococcus sp. PCC 7305]|uniref:hypothetical protein n=1 Tax=Xenococcus sp. PCC 7305 TaxID=102125 RepID=UPI0002AC14CE|nr:hypothetical protein [Xenococcus sp. PCC 7305]ELS05532.1 hypothetical protein Xen7305DRAFT_00052780 [Xenococcus sp. PCC 7305]
MNKLSQTILPLALGIGLAVGLDLSAIASPRNSHHYSRSGVVIISPLRHGNRNYNNYEIDYRNSRNIDYGRRGRYEDKYYNRGSRRRRSSRYDCDLRNRRVGSRNRRYHSGQRVNPIPRPRIYRDSPSNGGSVRVIRY